MVICVILSYIGKGYIILKEFATFIMTLLKNFSAILKLMDTDFLLLRNGNMLQEVENSARDLNTVVLIIWMKLHGIGQVKIYQALAPMRLA